MFDGFHFSDDNPYTYGEGKRLITLAMEELRKDRSLRALGMDPRAKGRGAIKGRGGSGVWDFLSLTDRPRRGSFTNYPHLTLGVHDGYIDVATTIPNGVTLVVRHRLDQLSERGLIRLNAEILRRARKIIARGATFEAYALQRHYPSQSSPGIKDAELRFKLETSQHRHAGRVKHQIQWTTLFGELLREKHSNIQFGYRAILPSEMKGLDGRKSLQLIVESWRAIKPLLDVVRG